MNNFGTVKMASIQDTEHKQLKKAVKCASCPKNLNEKSLVFLHCRHSFCEKCVETLPRCEADSDKSIQCTVCDQFELEGNLKAVNAELLEVLLTHADEDPKEEDEVLSDADQELPGKVYCQSHTGYLIEMNCAECNQVICSHCKFNHHDTHKSENLPIAVERYKSKIKPILREVGKSLDHQSLKLETIEKKISSLENNKKVEKSRLQAHKDNIILEINKKVTAEFRKLSEEIERNANNQIEELEVTKNKMRKEVDGIDGVYTWANASTQYAHGPSLLKEYQSGIVETLEKLKSTELVQDDKMNIKLVQFQPSKPQLPSVFTLGEISTHNQSFANSPMERRKKPLSDIAFRLVKLNLQTLSSQIGRVEKTVKVDTTSHRLCIFEEKLFIPSANTNSINVFPLESEGEEVETILDLGEVNKPHCLHPLSEYLMCLAADSGLYTIDGAGHVKQRLHRGHFNDVFINKSKMIALEWKEKKIFIWSITDLRSPEVCFHVTAGEVDIASTICILHDYVYVCGGKIIVKYNTKGTLVQEYGLSGNAEMEELDEPSICAVDARGDLLVAESGNHRLQVLSSSTGKWSNVKMKIYKPRDVVIRRSTMYVLHSEGNKISLYPL